MEQKEQESQIQPSKGGLSQLFQLASQKKKEIPVEQPKPQKPITENLLYKNKRILAMLLGGKDNQPSNQNGEHEEDQKVKFGGLTSMLGAQILANMGKQMFSFKLVSKLKTMKLSAEAQRMLNAIELGNTEIAEKYAFTKEFINENKYFIESGEPIKIAIMKDQIEFASRLFSAGYLLPKNLIIEVVKNGNDALLHRVINAKLYPTDEEIVLNFWFLLYKFKFESARIMYDKDVDLKEFLRYAEFPSSEYINEFLSKQHVITRPLQQALRQGQDAIAVEMILLNPKCILTEMIQLAIKGSCMQFLLRVWSGNLDSKQPVLIRKPIFLDNLTEEIFDIQEQKQFHAQIKLSNVLNQLLENKKWQEAWSIMDWPGVSEEPGLVKTALKHRDQRLAIHIIKKINASLSYEDMESAINMGLLDTAIEMLKWKECRSVLENFYVQRRLVDLISNGETCLAGIEMLNRIKIQDFDFDLLKNLCMNIQQFQKSGEELTICSKPILFCVLCAEFLIKLSEVSLTHRYICQKTASSMLDLGEAVQNAIRDEIELRFYLSQKDSQGRDVLTIAARNRFYTLLQNDEIGSIVSKMWEGSRRNYGLLNANTIYKSFMSPIGSEESLAFTKGLDRGKPYMFQFEMWSDDSSLRFLAQAISSYCLVVWYQALIYIAIQQNTFYDVSLNSQSLQFLRLSQVWIISINVENVLLFIFSYLSMRGLIWTKWHSLDLLMLIIMGLLMLEINKQVTDQIASELINSLMHCTLACLCWIRSLKVLITTKTFGPLIRMLYLMLKQIAIFMFIYACLWSAFTAMLTALYYNREIVKLENGQNITVNHWKDGQTTVKELIAGYFGNFGEALYDFDLIDKGKNTYYGKIGTLIFGTFLVLSAIILLSLLIAVLTNIYEKLVNQRDSEHRAVVIEYYNQLYWDRRYGFLIFLCPPFTIFQVIHLLPFILIRKPEYYNERCCKFYFFIYAVCCYIIFLAGSIIFFIPMYIKGFFSFGYSGNKKYLQVDIQDLYIFRKQPKKNEIEGIPIDENTREIIRLTYEFNFSKALSWLFIGFILLFWSAIRDSLDYWETIYMNLDSLDDDTDKTKMEQLVNSKLIQIIQMIIKDLTSANRQEIKINEFLEMWQLLDQHLTAGEENNQEKNAQDEEKNKQITEKILKKKKLMQEYMWHFANALNDPVINVARLRKLLPKRPDYDDEYIQKAANINVPAILKGIRNYNAKLGGMIIGNTVFSKKLMNLAEEQYPGKDVDHVLKEIHELKEKYLYINYVLEKLVKTLESRKRTRKNIF